MKNSTNQDVEVKFFPSYKTIKVPVGTSLIEAANLAGIALDSTCGHKGICGKCKIKILSGRLSAWTEAEIDHLGGEGIAEGWVLACQRTVLSDASFLVERDFANTLLSDAKPISATEIETPVQPDPVVYKKFLELSPPSPEDQIPDLERVLAVLPFKVSVELAALKTLPIALRKEGFSITATFLGKNLLTINPGDTTKSSYGIALDMGTTTVAGYIADLASGRLLGSASVSNPQGAFGADVISRINYCIEHKEGLARLQKSAADSVNQIISLLVKESQVSMDHVCMLTAVGNTTMSHLLLGVSPENIARAPFVPAFGGSIPVSASALGIDVPDYTKLLVLPNIGGYVGSDTVAAVLATGADKQSGTWLVVDIGTNGEIVLASKSRLLTCSTAAGPAFEGGGIECGMRAAQGAICAVTIDDDVQLSVIGAKTPMGICGSGLVDTISEMVRVGILKDNGRIKSPGECPRELPPLVLNRIRDDKKGRRFIISEGEREIAIFQKDIRNLQLAKGAIRAGIEVLSKELEISGTEFDAVLLAGAFGNNLRVSSLLGIDMLPQVNAEKIKFVGHAAGLGSYMALISRHELKRAEEITDKMEHIELSMSKGFQDLFVKYVNFRLD